jgi:hypothetical protein
LGCGRVMRRLSSCFASRIGFPEVLVSRRCRWILLFGDCSMEMMDVDSTVARFVLRLTSYEDLQCRLNMRKAKRPAAENQLYISKWNQSKKRASGSSVLELSRQSRCSEELDIVERLFVEVLVWQQYRYRRRSAGRERMRVRWQILLV